MICHDPEYVLRRLIAAAKKLRDQLDQELASALMESVDPQVDAGNATLVGTAKVAEMLGVSQRTVRRWHSQGSLPPAILIGDKARWRQVDIEAWSHNRGSK